MRFQIKNEWLEATFDTLGAELISLKSAEREYMWEGNPDFWNKHSPVLFPIVGALRDDSYFFETEEYQLTRHGFAREKEFKVIEQSADKIVFSLQNDSETLKVYPFYFELQIEYLLMEQNLEVHYKVKNNSDGKMYFSIGGHPAFKLPQQFENYALFFETDGVLKFSVLENNLLVDEKKVLNCDANLLQLNYQLFEKDALVFKNHHIQTVTIKEFENTILKVEFDNFPDLGIWTKNKAPFICIEPWFGHADLATTNQNLHEKSGIQILESQAVFKSVYTISVF
jgi:galactose mutarotase-like enzyme